MRQTGKEGINYEGTCDDGKDNDCNDYVDGNDHGCGAVISISVSSNNACLNKNINFNIEVIRHSGNLNLNNVEIIDMVRSSINEPQYTEIVSCQNIISNMFCTAGYSKNNLGVGEYYHLTSVVENVREGTFDKILTKPFNPLLYLTFSSIDIEGLAEVLTGLILIIWAFLKLNIAVSINLLIYIIIILIALIFMYSLMIIISSLAFIFIKSFALFELLFKLLDIGRYPMSIYGFEMRIIFTFLIPVAVVSFYPASALLGTLNTIRLFEIIIPVGIFLILSILMWNISIKKYTSAGG